MKASHDNTTLKNCGTERTNTTAENTERVQVKNSHNRTPQRSGKLANAGSTVTQTDERKK